MTEEEEADFFTSEAEWPGDVSTFSIHSDNPNPDNTYGFSTTDEDNYFPRVISEAKPETNFLFITDKNIDTGNKNSVLLVRKNILNIGYKFPHVKLAYIPLSEWLDAPSTVGEDWVSATQACNGDFRDTVLAEIAHVNELLEQEKRAENNRSEGRTVRVTVESFPG